MLPHWLDGQAKPSQKTHFMLSFDCSVIVCRDKDLIGVVTSTAVGCERPTTHRWYDRPLGVLSTPTCTCRGRTSSAGGHVHVFSAPQRVA